MRAIVVTEPGRLAPADVPEPSPGPGELLVDVAAAGVNRADLLQAAGHYPPPPGAPAWPGLEVSGTVAALGAGVTGWAPGDRLAALLPGGGYAARVTVPAGLALPVDGSLDLVDAASLPEALATVWSTLARAGFSAGDSVLVRGGSGGIGTVAVQLARAAGARVLATAGGPDRCARVRQLGAEVVVDHREPGLVDAVLAATDGRGVDVVFDVVGAAALTDNLTMLADDGRLAVVGLQQGRRADLDLGLMMARRASLVVTALRSRPLPQKLAIMADVRDHVWPMVLDGRVRPVVHARLALADAAEAHRAMAAGEPFGKLLLLP